MRHTTAAVIVSLLFALSAPAGTLSTEESSALVSRATMIKEAMDRGDADTIIAMTHPSIFRLTNGREGFEKLTRDSLAQIASLKIKIIESTLGIPTSTYQVGDETVCFVPRTTLMSIQDKKVRSIGFLIAARSAPDSEWLFLDGAGLRKNPGLLKVLFPDLPENVDLPENRREIIE